MHLTLWILAGLLATVFAVGGVAKLVIPAERTAVAPAPRAPLWRDARENRQPRPTPLSLSSSSPARAWSESRPPPCWAGPCMGARAPMSSSARARTWAGPDGVSECEGSSASSATTRLSVVVAG